MFDEKRAENRDQSAFRHWPGKTLALHIGLTVPIQYMRLHLFATSAILHAVLSPVVERRQKGISRKVRAPHAVNALLHQEFLSPCYKAGRYASQVVYAQIYLQRSD